MALTTPFDVAFPVNFYSNGDTTKDAFYKHIQEIKRIYGIINAVNADKLSADEYAERLQRHIDDTNPHPNYKPSLSFSDISGDLAGSRIIGELTRATISKDKVTGLQSFVTSLIPAAPPDKGDGIVDLQKSQSGFVKFNNGLIVQWGISDDHGIRRQDFHFPFPTVCYVVVGCTYEKDGISNNGHSYGGSYNGFHINDWDNAGFGYYTYTEERGSTWCSYIAIGE